MSTIRVICPTCNAELEIDEKHAGQEVECGNCFQTFVAEAKKKPYRMRRTDDDDDDRPAPRRRSRRDEDDYDYDDYPDRRRGHGGVPPKSRAVYIILAIFLGGLGVHNFYANRTSPGVAQLLIWLLSWPLMLVFIGCVTIFIPGIWALIDIIAVETDGDGRRMV